MVEGDFRLGWGGTIPIPIAIPTPIGNGGIQKTIYTPVNEKGGFSGITVGSGLGIESSFGLVIFIKGGFFPMTLGHEQLDVYRAAIEYVGWAYHLCEKLKGQHRNAKEQLLRASQAIPLNIAEGNGKATEGDRRRFFEIARGSALECGAVQDVLEVCGVLSSQENADAKKLLERIVAMLTKLGRRGYSVHEEQVGYGKRRNDPDSDPDPD